MTQRASLSVLALWQQSGDSNLGQTDGNFTNEEEPNSIKRYANLSSQEDKAIGNCMCQMSQLPNLAHCFLLRQHIRQHLQNLIRINVSTHGLAAVMVPNIEVEDM